MEVTTEPITPAIGLEVTGLTGRDLVDPVRAAECQAAIDLDALYADPDTLVVPDAGEVLYRLR